MKVSAIAATIVAMLLATFSARGQVASSTATATATAKIDVQPLELIAPERYQVPSVLEPVRRVTLIATSDSILRNQDAKAGAMVRDGQEVAQLDRTEAMAKLKIAQAVVKEEKALLEGFKGEATQSAVAEAHLEAALAKAELAQLELDRTTIRAPFAGMLLSSPLSDGQFVTKGTVVAELADVASLRVLLPLSRAAATLGGVVTLNHDGKSFSGKIQALVPLPESFSVLHELTTPFTGAWVLIANPDGKLETGQRIRSPGLPDNVLATIPEHALSKPSEPKDQTTIQVIRNEYVTALKVKRLGSFVSGTVQVSGPLRLNDLLILSSSVPLAPGTLVRFNSAAAPIEGTNPDPNVSGTLAELTPPKLVGRAAPIGPPGSAAPKTSASKKAGTRPALNPRGKEERSAPKAAGENSAPF